MQSHCIAWIHLLISTRSPFLPDSPIKDRGFLKNVKKNCIEIFGKEKYLHNVF